LIQAVLNVSDTDKDPIMRWEGPNKLVLIAPCGRIYSYSNSFLIYHSDKDWKEIYIGLDNTGLCK